MRGQLSLMSGLPSLSSSKSHASPSPSPSLSSWTSGGALFGTSGQLSLPSSLPSASSSSSQASPSASPPGRLRSVFVWPRLGTSRQLSFTTQEFGVATGSQVLGSHGGLAFGRQVTSLTPSLSSSGSHASPTVSRSVSSWFGFAT